MASRPAPAWKKVLSPEISAINKILTTLSNSNFEGNKEKFLTINVLEAPDNLELIDLKRDEDNSKILPIVRSFIDSLACAKSDDYVSVQLYANIFAELTHNWRGRQKIVLFRNMILKLEEELINFDKNDLPEDEDDQNKILRKISNILTFLVSVYLYKNYKAFPVQIPIRALHMLLKNNEKNIKVIMPCLRSENFSQIVINPVFGKYFRDNLKNSLEAWKEDLKGKVKFDVIDFLKSLNA